jgi:maltoporin
MNKNLLSASLLLATSTISISATAGTPEFFGYARMGAAASDGERVNPEASTNSSGHNIIKTAGSRYQATGRLGNEGNGLEFGLRQKFESTNGSKWDGVIFMDDGYDGTGDTLKVAQVYAGGSNVIASQPEAYFWAGRRFNNRIYDGLNDHFILVNDGNGGGVDNLDLGFSKYDIAVVAGDNGNSGRYVWTNRLHGIDLWQNAQLSLQANYGFYVGESEEDQNDNVQLLASIKQNWSKGFNELFVRYSENTRRNAIGWGDPTTNSDLESFGVYDNGSVRFTDNFTLEYTFVYESNDFDGNKETWSQAIVRPTYAWNNYTSTMVDFGYDQVEFEQYEATNSSYKVTLAQTLQLDMFTWSRPQLRLYVTHGQLDTESTEMGSQSSLGKSDATTVGVMFDAYW